MSDLLIHVTRRAMACEFEVQFPAERYPQGTELALESLDLVESLEEELSFFRTGSQVSRINLLAAEERLVTPEPLFALLELAMSVYRESQGAYDITSTPLWEAWGFARRNGIIPTDADLDAARSCVGGHFVELDPVAKTVYFLRPGIRINLGSIGKGHALDVCAEHLAANGMADFLLHGGQSSVLARGNRPSSHPWEIGIPHPGHPDRRIGTIRLRNRALGTSGGQFQSFRHQGHRYGHILDPRSGWPAEGVLSATVVAPTAALADALSTTFYVIGPHASFEYCKTHPEIAFVLTCPAQHGGGISVYTTGLAENELSLTPPYGANV